MFLKFTGPAKRSFIRGGLVYFIYGRHLLVEEHLFLPACDVTACDQMQ